MIYNIKQIQDFLDTVELDKIIQTDKKIIYDIPMSFDIETSSFYKVGDTIMTNDDFKKSGIKKGEKRAIMYIWQFAIENNVIYGRTWEDFLFFIHSLKKRLELDKKYIIVYVHNLSYEFQFISRLFDWVDIFADSERKPFKAETKDHIIFKCSYRLSGYSLAVLANNLKYHNIRKMVGDLDYNLIRNSKTVLSNEEMKYCVNDVLIVTAYIAEEIFEWGDIANIPLTQTGKVRRFVRQKCFNNPKYKFMIAKLTIDKAEYMLLKNAFAGGFTHCNAMYTDCICKDVTSFDFTSSYPTVLISEKYPMSKGKVFRVKDVKQLVNLCYHYSVLVDLRFTKIESTFLYENILSYSKCREIEKPLINNGRIVKADKLSVTMTNIDFLNMFDFYKWEGLEIGLCYVYENDYLPKEIINTILTLYKKKTELKGVVDKEVEYLHSKELLNSIYGMCVTSIVHDSITFENGEWKTENGNIEHELDIYNTDKNRFLFYQWGVWCTAYARNNLYTAIKECKADYIYSDTDSVKILHAEKHKEYFDLYNQWITEKLTECLKHYNINPDMVKPKTIEGVEKPLGVWDFDGFYKRFKTLGAKRYVTENEDNELNITVCGLSKKAGKEYIIEQEDPFIFFNNGMYVDEDHTGKMTHTYIDKEIEGFIIDYQGNRAYYHEQSYIHLEKTDYLLSLTKMYIDYFKGVQRLFK